MKLPSASAPPMYAWARRSSARVSRQRPDDLGRKIDFAAARRLLLLQLHVLIERIEHALGDVDRAVLRGGGKRRRRARRRRRRTRDAGERLSRELQRDRRGDGPARERLALSRALKERVLRQESLFSGARRAGRGRRRRGWRRALEERNGRMG